MESSVYLSVSHRYHGIFAPEGNCPVYKVNVPAADSSSSPVASSSATSSSRERVAVLETVVEGMSFVALPSAGWIIGVGGYARGTTIIIDTTNNNIIRGPNLLAAKCWPILAAVGHKVYALCNSPSYIDEPNFVPWFEVLDLSKGTVVVVDADGTNNLRLDGCSWEELPCPPCFPRKLTPTGYLHPPIISVLSYVLVLPYMLLSLTPQTSWQRGCTYAFDTGSSSGDWHRIDGKSLPFVGRATPHKGRVFLGTSLANWSVNAYRISVSTSSSSGWTPSTLLGVSRSGGNKGSAALKLSITACSIRSEEERDGRVGTTAGQDIVSLDGERFCLVTFSLHDRKRSRSYYYGDEDCETYWGKLSAKLTTYRIENPALLEEPQDQQKLQAVKYEIAVSKQREQDIEFSSTYGFSSPPITFALSI